VKTYKRSGSTVTLVPSNARLKPMVFDAGEVTVFGKVVTVMRRL
jgi:SOS-response transcriptional repressor LexA